MKWSKLRAKTNVEAFAELNGDVCTLFIPTKKSKVYFWGDKKVFSTKSETKTLEIEATNPGWFLSIHKDLKRYLEKSTHAPYNLVVGGYQRFISKEEAFYLEKDFEEIAKHLQKEFVKKTIRNVSSIMFANDFSNSAE